MTMKINSMDKKSKQSKVTIKFTVYFEEPFWIGVIERMEGECLSACKVTFGAEPKDYEVNEYLASQYFKLRFSPAVTLDRKPKEHKNPKRVQRLARREVNQTGTGTKSQQALKLLQEENKVQRKVVSREMKLAVKERMYALKQQKKKEKKRGR